MSELAAIPLNAHFCGLPSSKRKTRCIAIFVAFIDDSDMNQPPVSILAGWVAKADVWASFSDYWEKVLHMSPRIEYFKYVEAMSFRGEFEGISRESRDEKLVLLANAIADHDLLGISTIVPHEIFHRFFGKQNDVGVMKHPYSISFFQIIRRIYLYMLTETSHRERVDFVFDKQLDQMKGVLNGWIEFKEHFSKTSFAPFIGSPPSFKNDKDVVALQAADMHAGWARKQYAALIEGKSMPVAPWGPRVGNLNVITWAMDEQVAQELYYGLRL